MSFSRLVLLSLLFLSFGIPAKAQSLSNSLSSAYETNPELKAQRSYLRSVDEGVAEALSGWRPNISASASYNRVSIEGRQAGVVRGESLQSTRSAGINISQSLFEGMKTVNQTSSAKNNVYAQRQSLIAKEQEILLNSAIAHLDVVRDKAVLELQKNNENVLSRHYQASKDRFSVGEITKTDVSQAKARLSGAQAKTIQAKGNLEASKATYIKLVGVRPIELKQPQITDYEMPKDIQEALVLAQKNNPSLKTAVYSKRASSDNVDVVRGDFLPTVTLVGSATRNWDENSRNERLDVLTAGVNVSIPLYTSGATRSALRKAKHIENQSWLNVNVARKSVEEATKRAWENYQATTSRIDSIKAQIRASRLALEGVQKEAQVGSRTVLDVLDAEQEYLDARVSLVGARRDQMAGAFQLLSAIGKFNAKNLNLAVDYYSPEANFNDVKWKWMSTSVDKEE